MTDPGHPETCNVCHYWEVFEPEQKERVWEECRSSKRGCTQNKQELSRRLIQVTEPFRASQEKFKGGQVEKILIDGAQRARKEAQETMRQVRAAIGLPEQRVS